MFNLKFSFFCRNALLPLFYLLSGSFSSSGSAVVVLFFGTFATGFLASITVILFQAYSWVKVELNDIII